jgi:hypothetical protein
MTHPLHSGCDKIKQNPTLRKSRDNISCSLEKQFYLKSETSNWFLNSFITSKHSTTLVTHHKKLLYIQSIIFIYFNIYIYAGYFLVFRDRKTYTSYILKAQFSSRAYINKVTRDEKKS